MSHPDGERYSGLLKDISIRHRRDGHRTTQSVRADGATGKGMNHHQLESALDHLEHVLARISGTDHIPLSYWRKRVDDVSAAARIPAQKNRARRLDEALSALESRAGA